MLDQPTAHALLRDRSHWRGELVGLTAADDGDARGDLVLERVPGPADGKPIVLATPLPYPRAASGLALGPCNAVFVADTAHDRVLYVDGLDGSRFRLPPTPGPWHGAPGQFSAPRGLVCSTDAVLVADSGAGRIQSLAWPRLEAHLAFGGGAEPVSLAIDAQQRVVIVDAATASVHRVNSRGNADAAFDAKVAASAKLLAPLFVACDGPGRVYVSDTAADAVFVFASDGSALFALPDTTGWQPGAVAAQNNRVYVADAASSAIVAFDVGASGASRLGSLPAWLGPVTAMAVADDGALYIKTALDDTFYCLPAGLSYLPSGTLTAGPLDAGEDRCWERAWADAVVPPGTALQVEIAVGAAPSPAPTAADWVALASADALIAELTTNPARFVWWRLTLTTNLPAVTPRVQQARVATAAEDLLDYLPLTYRLTDADAGGLLSRWLRLLRGEYLRVEEALDAMPRAADPSFATPQSLTWLARWIGLELPQIADETERRALIARAVSLFARRGTSRSIAEFVELHTGIRPAIVEAFTQRGVWILGTNSRLGFDTCLAPLDPLGLVVADPSIESGCCPTAPATPRAPTSPCRVASDDSAARSPLVAIGRAIVGESGPLDAAQIGLPLFAEEAYRFCVVIDSYRAGDPATLQEIKRIVDREKPAHTDYRIELVGPDLRIGLQASIGIDAIVGGEPPPLRLGQARLADTTYLPPPDAARIGEAALDGSLTLT